MRIVIAPDSFKGSATATQVAAAIAEGWAQIRPDDVITQIPMADGGEGTIDAIHVSDGGELHTLTVQDPIGDPVQATWLLLPDGTAVVELASSSSIAYLKTLDPLNANTFGFGQVLRAAAESGAKSILATLGGSASTDGGAGALQALDGIELPPITCLVDVRNPLLGPNGAAAVFGPQKGADELTIAVLEQRLHTLSKTLGGNPDQPGAGAAGGTAYGLAAAYGADFQPGATTISQLVGLPEAIANADVIITGEGKYDHTSAHGKVVSAVFDLSAGKQTALVVGQLAIPAPCPAYALADLAGSGALAIADPLPWLIQAGARLAAEIH
jgi:glycerate kinase